MFQHWLDGNGVKPCSWHTLIELLEVCDQQTLAEEIQEALTNTRLKTSNSLLYTIVDNHCHGKSKSLSTIQMSLNSATSHNTPQQISDKHSNGLQ